MAATDTAGTDSAPPRRVGEPAGDGDVRLTVVSDDLGEIVRLSEALESFCSERGVGARAVLDLNLALEEVLTNVISYGFDGMPPGNPRSIGVRFAERGGMVEVEVSDTGAPFDPLARADVDITLDASERRIGGLGIHLLKKLMDSVEYRRQGERNVLAFRRAGGRT